MLVGHRGHGCMGATGAMVAIGDMGAPLEAWEEGYREDALNMLMEEALKMLTEEASKDSMISIASTAFIAFMVSMIAVASVEAQGRCSRKRLKEEA